MPEIVWTNYFRQRMRLREFIPETIESIVRFSSERYYDVETDRLITVGKHRDQLILIAYEQTPEQITPVTVHVTTRQQIRFRVKTGRFIINV